MALRGSPELRRRLKAIKTVFKPTAREWSMIAKDEARRRIPVATGRTRASISRRATTKKATVFGNYPVNFIDAGTKAHDIVPKRAKVLAFDVGGTTIFAKKVHKRAVPARPFKKESAQVAWDKVDILRDLIDLWNKAA